MSKQIIYATRLMKAREHLQIVQAQKEIHRAEHIASRLKVVKTC